MLFRARREQRPIPVIHPPENKMLEFIATVSSLYYKQKEFGDCFKTDRLFSGRGQDQISTGYRPAGRTLYPRVICTLRGRGGRYPQTGAADYENQDQPAGE